MANHKKLRRQLKYRYCCGRYLKWHKQKTQARGKGKEEEDERV